MDTHLDEMAIEALAHGRPDLVPVAARAHLHDCEACGAALREARTLSGVVGVALREPSVQLDMQAMIAKSLEHVPTRPPVSRPTRLAVWWAGTTGLLVAASIGLLSMGGLPSLTTLVGYAEHGFTVGAAVDRLVDGHVPGAWTSVSLVGFLIAALLLVPFSLLLKGRGTVAGIVSAAGLALLASLPSPVARALEFSGEWPAEERVVTVSVDRVAASEALRVAAESVGLGLVARLPEDPLVSLHVRDASLREVVAAVLGDAEVEVERTPRLLILRPVPVGSVPGTVGASGGKPDAGMGSPSASGRGGPEMPPAPPEPPLLPAPNRETFGQDIIIRAGERVGEVVTMGGDARVEGEVVGGVVTMGGDVDVRPGGIVHGDVVSMGGDVRVRERGTVHGDIASMGGEVRIEEQANVRGAQVAAGAWPRDSDIHVSLFNGEDHDEEPSAIAEWFGDALSSAVRHALLFMLGLILLGAAPERLGSMQRAIVRAPLRSMATGLLGLVLAAVLSVVLVITLVGIPGALVVVLLSFVAAAVGLATVASVVGALLPVAWGKNRPVVQLAIGIGGLFLLSLLPVIGTVTSMVTLFFGFGAVVLTRFGKSDLHPVSPPPL